MRAYAELRLAQLRSSGVKLWVYNCIFADDCPPEHIQLDGVCLPPDHPFWSRYFPPNGEWCGCHVSGAHSAKLAPLLGGDLDKPLPEWWVEGRGLEVGYDGELPPCDN